MNVRRLGRWLKALIRLTPAYLLSLGWLFVHWLVTLPCLLGGLELAGRWQLTSAAAWVECLKRLGYPDFAENLLEGYRRALFRSHAGRRWVHQHWQHFEPSTDKVIPGMEQEMTETNSMRAEVFLGEFRAACEEIRAGAGYPQNLRTVATLVGLPEAVVASIVATMAAHANISPARVFDGLLRFSLRMAFDSFGASAQRITEVLRELEAEVPDYELDELRCVGEGWETTERAVQAAQLKALDGALGLLDALQRVLDQAVDKGLTAENPEL